MKERRFVQVFQEDNGLFGPESRLIVDKETGVTYLVVGTSFGAGVTPLLKEDGKPFLQHLKETDQ